MSSQVDAQMKLTELQLHNVFMRVNVSLTIWLSSYQPFINKIEQDPVIQKATGKTDPVDVMAALREMKNAM